MREKILSHLSNGTLIAGGVIGIYALVDSYLVKSKLPAGACPVENNSTIFYTAIVLCLISFVLSFFDRKPEKK